MISSVPQFRRDLIVRCHQTAGGPSFVIKDPDSGRYFRLGEAEGFIVQQLDGETSLDIVRKRAEEKFDAVLPVEMLRAFIGKLEKTGLLEAGHRRSRQNNRRLQGNPLYLRVKLFDPSLLFARLRSAVECFFTPHFLVISTTLILLAIGIAVSNWNHFLADLPRLYGFTPALIFITLAFLVVSAHECAHGLTCTHFGGEVHEIGFLLIYFQPALYCNVSDSWLFPEKRKRLWVGIAGPYLELFLWALAVLAWRVTDRDTWINEAGLMVMTSSGIKTLLNLNPMIKFDGYYLLSDYLEIPNLRKKAFFHFGQWLKRAAGIATTPVDIPSGAERRILFLYGLTATAGSFVILIYILTTAGGYLVDGKAPIAVALSMVLIGLRFRRRLRRLFTRNTKDTGTGVDLDDYDLPEETASVEGASSTVHDPPQAPATPPPIRTNRTIRKRKPRSVARIIWLAVAGIALLAVLFGRTQLKVSGPFNILPGANVEIRGRVEGIIERVHVDEGARVHVGEPIAQILVVDQRAELQKVKADIEAKRARLSMLVAGARPEELDVARKAIETGQTKQEQAMNLYSEAVRSREERLAVAEATVQKARERLPFAERSVEMYQTLVSRGLGPQNQLNEVQEQLSLRKRELDEAVGQREVLLADSLAEMRKNMAISEKETREAEGRLSLLMAGTRREEIEALQADIRSSEAQRDLLTEQIEAARILSPASGIVATPSRQLRELRGQLLKKGDLVATIHDSTTAMAIMVVSEKEIADVQVGQKVDLRVRAYPTRTFHGMVTSIATSAAGGTDPSMPNASDASPASAASKDKSVVVTTTIENSQLLLKPEMTGEAKIYCGSHRISELILRRAARTFRVEVWSWW